MPEELEVPIEHAQEHIHHHATHSTESWVSQVALSSAIVAVLAAVAALFAGHHSNEAVIDQIKAANKWAYFQSKGVKSDVLTSKLDLLAGLDKPVSDKDKDRAEKLNKDKEQSMEEAKSLEESGENHLKTHNALGQAVTFFQITIAIGAVAVLTKRRRFFLGSLVFGAVGFVFLAQGFLMHFTMHFQ